MTGTTLTATRSGKGWSALELSPGRWVVSVETEFELMAALQDFATRAGICSGEIGGVGACHRVTLSFRNPVTKAYDDTVIEEQMEIVNLTGNVFQVDGVTRIHVHGTFGRQDLTARAGHVKEIWIRGAGEVFVTGYPTVARKVPDEGTGLNLYNLR